jgi:hypothetical protein
MSAGTYYLRIEGKGNMYAPAYASLGSYALNGTYTGGNPLPLRRLELSGLAVGDQHKLNWLIDADEQVVEQILEVSTDGLNYSPVVIPATDLRAYSYRPYVTGNAQYRMNVTFDNGKQHYSNIVILRKTGTVPKPQLVSNVIGLNDLLVTSPASYDYHIFDLNGKSITGGKLVMGTNHIQLPGVVNGMFVIRFMGSGESWVEKFIRQ